MEGKGYVRTIDRNTVCRTRSHRQALLYVCGVWCVCVCVCGVRVCVCVCVCVCVPEHVSQYKWFHLAQ